MRTLCGLGMVLLAGCPAGLVKSVDAVGKTGAKITDLAVAFDDWGPPCETLAVINAPVDSFKPGAKPVLDCAAFEDAYGRVEKVALALAAYGDKLSAVATGTDVAIGDKQTGAMAAVGLAGWTKDDTKTRIVTAVVALFSERYREGQLDSIVKLMQKPVDDADDEIDEAAAAATQVIASGESKIKEARDSLLGDILQKGGTGTISYRDGIDLLALKKLGADLETAKKTTQDLKTGVDAFRKGHDVLAQHADDLERDDVLANVKTAIAQAFGGS